MPRTKAESAPALPDFSKLTPDQLLAEHFRLDDWVAGENKRFGEHLAPTKASMEAIKNELHARLNALGGGDKANISTGAGTAYLSNIMNVSVTPEGAGWVDPQTGIVSTGREALIDFALANWDEIGNELLMVQAQKDAVKRYLEEKGSPPPGLKVGWIQRVNVRRG